MTTCTGEDTTGRMIPSVLYVWATVAHADYEAGLAEQEKNHVCDPAALAGQSTTAKPPPLTNAPQKTPVSNSLRSQSKT